MPYVDGYLVAVPRKNLKAYRKMASDAGKMWMKYGAVEYRECVGEDLNTKIGVSFRRILKLKPGEAAIFSWIVFKSRAHRDRVNARVMKDPKMGDFDPKTMPFDMKRMVYGGFTTIVDL